MANKTVVIDGVEVPVVPAKAEEIIKNKVTGQTYATIEEFNEGWEIPAAESWHSRFF